MEAAEIDHLLNIPISSKAFATMETSVRGDVLEDPYAFFQGVREKRGDVIRVDDATVEGVLLPFLGSRDPDRPVYIAMGFDTVRSVVGNNKAIYQNYGESMDVLMGENQLAGMNPPLHQKYRSLVSKAFELHSLPMLTKTVIEPLVDGMIDRIATSDRTELMEALACRLPVLLIGHICALPTEKYNDFARAAGALMANPYDWSGAVVASAQLKEMFEAVIAEKRENPGSDLISKLILSEVDGERLSQSDIISTCRALVPAGIETTVRALGTLCAAILRFPEQAAQVRDNPSLVPTLIDELLRWNGPAQMLPKRTLEETEIAGVTVPANAHLWCYIGHANRDPGHWERPDEFDIGRRKQPHLAFSFGTHFCVGNQFARREMEVVLTKLLKRLPGLRLDPDAAQPVVKGVIFRSPDHINAMTGAV